MSVPIAFHVNECMLRDGFAILLNGDPVHEVFNLNEAEGWVDVYIRNEHGSPFIVGDRPASQRLHGTVRVEMTDPEARAELERRFPATQMRLERTINELTTTFVRSIRTTTSPGERHEAERAFVIAIEEVLASDEG